MGITESFLATCNIDIQKGYPCLLNDPVMTSNLIQQAKTFLGEENVKHIEPRLTSEDFAYYSQIVPASFYRLGTRNEAKGMTSYVHTPTFDIDEDALKISTGLMAWMAVKELEM